MFWNSINIFSGITVTSKIRRDLNINVVRSTGNVTDSLVLFINIARYISKNHKEGITRKSVPN
jgi:hypothetical protein